MYSNTCLLGLTCCNACALISRLGLVEGISGREAASFGDTVLPDGICSWQDSRSVFHGRWRKDTGADPLAFGSQPWNLGSSATNGCPNCAGMCRRWAVTLYSVVLSQRSIVPSAMDHGTDV